HDAGTALGAAQVIYHMTLDGAERGVMNHAYWGPSFENDEIEAVLREHELRYERLDAIEQRVAELLSEQNVIGWFQGAMEYGPRALGNRSLLADPRDPEMKERLNLVVKHREDFRPFAPSILKEEAGNWFDINKPCDASDFMLVGYHAKQPNRIPSVVHVDGTSRVQTVKKETNPRYHKLISEFHKLTGVPVVLNTSYNDSEPIVCTPRDAVKTFLRANIDALAIGDFLVEKKNQIKA
ncbi:MAG: carbamoyltransferase C-terminal domain-containing protein, partial [Tumebacillaceae bacterium]